MKLKVKQTDLVDALETAMYGVSSKATMLPLLQTFLIEPNGGLTVVGSDLEIAVKATVPAQVEEAGDGVCVTARLLLETVKVMGKGEEVAALVSQRSPSTMTVTMPPNVARFNFAEAKEFPPLPQAQDGDREVTLDPKVLSQIATRVAPFAAHDESRPVLMGVDLVLDGKRLEAAAADGFRLAVFRIELEKEVGERTSAVLPARVFKALHRFAQRTEGPVTLGLGATQVHAVMSQVEVWSQVIQGTYPNYSQLVPEKYETRVVATSAELAAAGKLAGAVSETGIVRLQVDAEKQLLAFSCKGEEGESNGEIKLHEVKGPTWKVAMSNKYLADALAAIGTEQVALELTSPSSPVVFRPVGDDSLVIVVMPMLVQW